MAPNNQKTVKFAEAAPKTGRRNRKASATPTQPPPGQPAQSPSPSASKVNESTEPTTDPSQTPESILRKPLINIQGNLRLQGVWSLQSYEYNIATESLQLHRAPDTVLAPEPEEQNRGKGKGKRTWVRDGNLETIDEDGEEEDPRGPVEEGDVGGEVEAESPEIPLADHRRLLSAQEAAERDEHEHSDQEAQEAEEAGENDSESGEMTTTFASRGKGKRARLSPDEPPLSPKSRPIKREEDGEEDDEEEEEEEDEEEEEQLGRDIKDTVQAMKTKMGRRKA